MIFFKVYLCSIWMKEIVAVWSLLLIFFCLCFSLPILLLLLAVIDFDDHFVKH